MKRSHSNWKRPRIEDDNEPILERVIKENEIVEKEMMIENGIIVYVKLQSKTEFGEKEIIEKYIRINPNMEKEVLEYEEEHYYITWERDSKEKSKIQIRIVEGYKEVSVQELEYEIMYHLNTKDWYILFYVMKEEKYNEMRNYEIHNSLNAIKESESYSCIIYLDPEYQTDQEGKKMIKRLKKDIDYESIRSFVYEMKVYEKLKKNPHLNICRMYEKKILEDEEGSIFPGMVLEQGLDLRNTVAGLERQYEKMGKMKEYYLKMEEVIDQMIIGVQYFHKLGYIHFDIKPENFIFVNNIVKLIDFGQSEEKSTFLMSEKMRYKGTKGFTPIEIQYMKPSYLNDFDERIDVWSLGISILIILGRDITEYKILKDIKQVINSTKDKQERMNEIIDNTIKEYENITGHKKEMKELVYKMMKVDPKERTKLENVRTPVILWNTV